MVCFAYIKRHDFRFTHKKIKTCNSITWNIILMSKVSHRFNSQVTLTMTEAVCTCVMVVRETGKEGIWAWQDNVLPRRSRLATIATRASTHAFSARKESKEKYVKEIWYKDWLLTVRINGTVATVSILWEMLVSFFPFSNS